MTRPAKSRTSLTSVLLKRISALEAELAIAKATTEAAQCLHRRQVETLMREALARQIAQQAAERRLLALESR